MLLRIIVFVLALGAAGGAGLLMMKMQAQNTAQAEAAAAAAKPAGEVPSTLVLVAATDIAAGEVLAPTKLRWQPWPRQSLNERFIQRDARPTAQADLAGSFVNQGFAVGEPITESRLAAANTNLLSGKLSRGKRAASVKITAENTAGGFIQPGDHVDVLHTLTGSAAEGTPVERRSRIIVANVRVLAIDQKAEQSSDGTAVGETATLELSPQQAERVTAAESTGMLSLVLRAVTDHEVSGLEEAGATRTVRVHRGSTTDTVTLH